MSEGEWRIDPERVAEVIAGVDEGLARLDELADPEAMLQIVERVAPPGPMFDSLRQALGAALAFQLDHVEAVTTQVRAAREGVVAATAAYVDGDLELAAECQRRGVEAARTGDLSWFEGRARQAQDLTQDGPTEAEIPTGEGEW